MISFHQPHGQEDLRRMSPSLSATTCDEPDLEAKRREEEEAEKNYPVHTFENSETEGRGGGTKTHIKFKLPNNASYLVPRDSGQNLDNIISISKLR